jgi:hypothetical protein
MQVLSAGHLLLQIVSGLAFTSIAVEQILDQHPLFFASNSQSRLHRQVNQGFVREDRSSREPAHAQQQVRPPSLAPPDPSLRPRSAPPPQKKTDSQGGVKQQLMRAQRHTDAQRCLLHLSPRAAAERELQPPCNRCAGCRMGGYYLASEKKQEESQVSKVRPPCVSPC